MAGHCQENLSSIENKFSVLLLNCQSSGLIKAANLRCLDFLKSVYRSDHEVDGRSKFPFLAFRYAATAAYEDTSGYDSHCQTAPTPQKLVRHAYSEVTNTLLDGKTRGELSLVHFVPKLIEPLRLCRKRTRQILEGTQIAPKLKSNSLDVYKRS